MGQGDTETRGQGDKGIGEEVRAAIESGKDVITIERDHVTGDLSWRFDCPQTDPLALLMRVAFHQMMNDGGYAARLAQVERIVK